MTQGVEKIGVFVEAQINMKPLNFTNFLENGALLRSEPDNWFLLEGPFEKRPDRRPGDIALFHPDFFSDSKLSYWIPKAFYRLTTRQMESLLGPAPDSPPVSMHWQEGEFQSFKQSFSAILEQIHQGHLQKAVPVVFEKSSEIPGPHERLAMLRSLLKAPGNLYVFGSWEGDQGILGATPEVLLRQSGTQVSTMALAGTCPKTEATQRRSLLEDPKERLEHDLVVQDILQSLGRFGTLTTQGPGILELPTLFHLKTEIACQLAEAGAFSFFEACQGLHPTPALGLSPRRFGYHWLQRLPEQKDRGGFGAPWGVQWAEQEALCLVAIRNIQWNESGARIGSGCGLVAQSDLQQEWRELFQKRQSVKKILGLES